MLFRSYVKPASTSAIAATDSVLDAIGKLEAGAGGILPHITIYAPTGCTITAANGGTTLTATETSGTYEVDVPRLGDWTLTCSKTVDGTPRSAQKVVSVAAVQGYSVRMSYGYMYGFRIKKSEGSPSARVEYLYDAVGKEPAHMDFTRGIFDYGDWANAWFVTDNKPLMLKSDGTVDYYLQENDYSKRADGTASDISNTSYNGNAMAQFPLVWIKRYEDTQYEYEIVSDVQIDSDYKAYAHTRKDGTIADFFYWSIYGGSGSASKIRSLSGQTLAQSLTAANEIAGCVANGSLWYTHTWSQRELIRTLLILMGKSTDTQSVFGNGNCRSASAASGMLSTGTLNSMGQFFGYNDSTHQVKVFHIEKFWGDQWDRTAGLINSGGKIYAKMTPEGQGYRVTDVTGYTNTGFTMSGTNGGYINSGAMTEYGFIPCVMSGSATTYYCDVGYFNNSQLDYLLSGAGATYAPASGGAFAAHLNSAPTYTTWTFGCGLSCEQPATA